MRVQVCHLIRKLRGVYGELHKLWIRATRNTVIHQNWYLFVSEHFFTALFPHYYTPQEFRA